MPEAKHFLRLFSTCNLNDLPIIKWLSSKNKNSFWKQTQLSAVFQSTISLSIEKRVAAKFKKSKYRVGQRANPSMCDRHLLFGCRNDSQSWFRTATAFADPDFKSAPHRAYISLYLRTDRIGWIPKQ